MSRHVKTRARCNAGHKKTVKRVRTKGTPRPRIKRMLRVPRLFLEDRVGRLCFKLVTRGAEFKDTTVVNLRCTAVFRLDACTAMSLEDKTWEAQLVGLRQNL